MKELNIEEKAKRYDEALEKVKDMMSYKEVRREDMEYLFPELKKSEDEKIRKWIINEIKINHHNLDEDSVDFVDKAIAWLEKQGEQKPNPYSGVSFEYNGHTWGMCARDGGVEIGYDKQLIANINPIREKDEFGNLSKSIDNKDIGCNTVDFIMSTAPNHGI